MLHGVRIYRRAHVVSSLFFADVILIFGRATVEELVWVKEIMVSYEVASDQMINLNKYDIMSAQGFQRIEVWVWQRCWV